MTLSQYTPTLDAGLVREVCAALLSTANRLLDRTHGLPTGSELGCSDQMVVQQPESINYDLDRELPVSLGREDSNEEMSRPSSSSTWCNELDVLPLDLSDWIDGDLNVSWQSDGGSHCDLGLSQDSAHGLFDMEGWSVQDNDKWPCFPG